MSQFQDSGLVTVDADGAVTQYAMCKLTASGAKVCVAADTVFAGSATRQADDTKPFALALHNKPGTHKVVLAGAVAKGAELYLAAAGKVDDSGTTKCGVAMMAGASGDVIEMLMN